MRSLARISLIPFLAPLYQVSLNAETVAISSVVFNGYARDQQPDGTFKPEFYTFGEGGCWSRQADPAMDKLKFIDVAKIVAGPLAKMNFRPALKSDDAQLLILVFWGSTEGSRSYDTDAINEIHRPGARDGYWKTAMEEQERVQLDDRNARIIGYGETMNRARSDPHLSINREVMVELGDNRYYVVLQAYDFRTAMKEKKLKPLWTTRMSVGEGGAFVPALETMVANAARYFGRDSDGLQRRREGRVDLAPMQVLEVVPAQK